MASEAPCFCPYHAEKARTGPYGRSAPSAFSSDGIAGTARDARYFRVTRMIPAVASTST